MTDARAGYWIPTKPVSTYRAVLVALLVGVGAATVNVLVFWSPLERFAFSGYVVSTLSSALPLGPKEYRQVRATLAGEQVHVTPADVTMVTAAGGDAVPVLTPAGEAGGLSRVVIETRRIANAEQRRILETHVYGRSLWRVFTAPAGGALLTCGVLLLWSVPRDLKRRKESRAGQHLRGASDILTVAEFNRRRTGGR